MTVVPTTGEVIAAAQFRATPEQVRADVLALQDVMSAALIEGQHYGKIPGTPRPSLYKAGAEWLLKWAGYGHRMEVVEVEREDDGRKYAVTYRAVVHLLHDAEAVVATCDGYCGYDEPDREAHTNRWGKTVPRSPWNTILKMAQKRALVGAALQATGASGLFTQDLEDHHPVSDDAPPPDPWVAMGWADKAEFDARLRSLVEAMKVAGGDQFDTLAERVKARRDELKADRPTPGASGWPVTLAEMATLEAWVAAGAPADDPAPEADEEATTAAGDDAGVLTCSSCARTIGPDESTVADAVTGAVWCETCMDTPADS